MFDGVLERLFRELTVTEYRAVIVGDFKDISTNDVHILEVIGKGTPKNMSAVAKILKVTVGTLTSAVNNLVKKGYLHRKRSEEDKRVVLLSLTEKGVRAYNRHEQFHKEMIEALLQDLNAEEAKAVMKAMVNLNRYLRQYN